MSLNCPHCLKKSESRNSVIKFGSFRRKSDQKYISRFRCRDCSKTFSLATLDPCLHQKKRHLNRIIVSLLTSGVSQRRCAKILAINTKTVVRKFMFMGSAALIELNSMHYLWPKAQVIQFDDLETFEHTKCKPLSVTLAVEEKSRRILGFNVCSMPAKGKIARIALKKYGPRKDDRSQARKELFQQVKPYVVDNVLIKSDQNPHYPIDVKTYFPNSEHIAYKGRRGCIVGQGELKKIGFDPLFSLNHTCAKLRADINRLFRRTWCTTKKLERLRLHIALEAVEHNYSLIYQ